MSQATSTGRSTATRAMVTMRHGAPHPVHPRAQSLRSAGRRPQRSAEARPRRAMRIGRTVHRARGTLRGMYTRRILSASAALFILGCGPTTINVTTTGEGEGGEESSSGAPISGSTGLGGTDSGVDTSTTEGASSGGSSDPNSGGGSTSTGEPLPEPLCEWNATPPVWCSCDGVPSHPTECGCVLADGYCVCEADPTITYPGTMCTDDVCTVDVITGACFCDSTPAPADACAGTCAAVAADDGWACLCGGIISVPVLCGCVIPAPGVCSCPGGADAPCIDPQGATCFIDAAGACSCAIDENPLGCWCGDVEIGC